MVDVGLFQCLFLDGCKRKRCFRFVSSCCQKRSFKKYRGSCQKKYCYFYLGYYLFLLFLNQVKKLVYVYLSRYAEEQQDLALLSISTFQRALKVYFCCTQIYRWKHTQKLLYYSNFFRILISWFEAALYECFQVYGFLWLFLLWCWQ